MKTQNSIHRGPHPGILAVIFTFLFVTGLFFVVSFTAGAPHFPNPGDPQNVIQDYFPNHRYEVLICAFFQFASAIPLGLQVASLTSRLRFLGNRATGPYIALFGGFLTTVNMALTALILWTLTIPGVAGNGPLTLMLYYLGFATGGVGYSVPFGIFIAGVAVSAGFMKVLPRWLVIFGIIVAACGELSCLTLVFPKLVPLIPLTRFPGFIWLIITGFMLPRSLKTE
jgi:hypothetical protein